MDTTVTVAAFRDHGRVLTASRTEPQVVRDLVAIARHRGWTTVRVDGADDFRRETWLTARAAGLEVRGYRPTERDRQALDRRVAARPAQPTPAPYRERAGLADPGPRTRLQIVETVVRNRIVEPADQNRILAAARGRIADWLERGARFDPLPDRKRDPDRRRER